MEGPGKHVISHGELAHFRTKGNNCSGEVPTDDGREPDAQGRVCCTSPLPKINGIDTRRRNSDENLAFAGYGIGNVFVLQDVGAAVLMHHYRFHLLRSFDLIERAHLHRWSLTSGRASLRAASRSGSMILLCGHPGADICRTVAKQNAIGGFVVAKVANDVPIGEDQIREVQNHDGIGRFRVDQVAQLDHVFSVESTADREHEGRVPPALNLEQCHDRM